MCFFLLKMYFKIWLSYNGLNYSGVGINNNECFITIRELITKVFIDNNIIINYFRFKSRTDAKVSAYIQYFIIETEKDISIIFYKIQKEIFSLTKMQVMLHSFEKIQNRDQITYTKKTYVYKITNNKNAVTYNTHFYFEISNAQLKTLKNWLSCLDQKKINYEMFCKEIKNNNRPCIQILQFKLLNIFINNDIQETFIYCTGECFMYKQVRMIVGTLLKILKKSHVTNIADFIQNLENKKYVYTAPGHALYLI